MTKRDLAHYHVTHLPIAMQMFALNQMHIGILEVIVG
jgi:hypothetical protein